MLLNRIILSLSLEILFCQVNGLSSPRAPLPATAKYNVRLRRRYRRLEIVWLRLAYSAAVGELRPLALTWKHAKAPTEHETSLPAVSALVYVFGASSIVHQ